jgi:flagellar hook-basal body complex protein FliE
VKIVKNSTYDLVGLGSNSLAINNHNVKINNNAQNVDFIDCLNQALNSVDDLQKQAQAASFKVAIDDADYLHNVMIAYEKANLALQLTIEVRNKIVEAYQDIMRIQM